MPLYKHHQIRILLGLLAIVLLGAVYMMQGWAITFFARLPMGENARFILSKTARFFLNDIACLLLISAIFNHTKQLRIGWFVFLIECVLILPVYFLLKLGLEGTSEISSPLLSQLHRMIVNPLLMFALMAGLLFQQYQQKKITPGTVK